jgi:hypothetical protein
MRAQKKEGRPRMSAFLFRAVFVGAIVWPRKAQTIVALLIEPKTATRLSDTRFVGKAVKICDLRNVKDFSFGFFGVFGPLGGGNYCNRDIAGLQNNIIFGPNHVAYFGSVPSCQAKWINCFVGHESIWTVILNHDAMRGYISGIVNGNAGTPNYRLTRRIGSDGRIAKINKCAISQSRCLVSLIQNPSSDAAYYS